MDTIDLQLLQRRVETLIARFEIVGQDVAALRQRLEEIKAHVDLAMESQRLHIDEGFARIEASNATVTALLRELLGRRSSTTATNPDGIGNGL